MAIPKKIAKGFVLALFFVLAVPLVLLGTGLTKVMKSIVRGNGEKFSGLSYNDLIDRAINKAQADAPGINDSSGYSTSCNTCTSCDGGGSS